MSATVTLHVQYILIYMVKLSKRRFHKIKITVTLFQSIKKMFVKKNCRYKGRDKEYSKKC